MPKVTPEHLAARREQVLDAALRCFSANGFHATSMQDILREAGMSAGAVYRYFPGKHAIIKAIAEQVIGQVLEELATLADPGRMTSLEAAMADALSLVEPRLDRELRMAVTVWGEAMRDPELATTIRAMYQRIRDAFAQIALRAQEVGELPPDADPTSVGAALAGLVQGYILQRVLVGGISRDQYIAGLRSLIGARQVTRLPSPEQPTN